MNGHRLRPRGIKTKYYWWRVEFRSDGKFGTARSDNRAMLQMWGTYWFPKKLYPHIRDLPCRRREIELYPEFRNPQR